MSPNFYLSTGELSSYGLACGYVEKKEFDGYRISMWKEHNAYHVQYFDKEEGRFHWDVFDTLGKARQAYRKTLMDLQRA